MGKAQHVGPCSDEILKIGSGSSGELNSVLPVRRAWQFVCKHFITTSKEPMMSPRLVMKRLQTNCQARRTDEMDLVMTKMPHDVE
ncbi:unnamed protein product [Echinostoma caproni]|uniref:SWIB domain-containing protein n=1 Tax=Echinostoma caproni TaxID=27848 RepID=A0A183BDM9_9TREM|nr:unnamed protein product [Echinostoma caproni]